jgi:hypothetical protein
MQAAPAADLMPMLEADPAFEVELFTKRTFGGLVEREERFDCLIVGYNAAHKIEVVREALAAHQPAANLCVLHQRRTTTAAFIPEQLGVDLVELDERAEPVRVAEHVKRHDELLVNFPERLELSSEAGETVLEGAGALCALAPSPGRVWRTIFSVEAGSRPMPVLLRSPTGLHPRMLVCTVLLEHTRPAHGALLRNMVMWCAAGRPDAVVVERPDKEDQGSLQRKLYLQGVRGVEHRIAGPEQLDFGAWPLYGGALAILPTGWDPTGKEGWPGHDPSNAGPWLRSGGRIVEMGGDGGLSMKLRDSDLRWVARRWLTWFIGTPPEAWHGSDVEGTGSIVATRAVLQTLAMIGAMRVEIDPDGELPLKLPEHFHTGAARLLRRRVGQLDNCDDTVSTTTAALEVDRLIGGAGLRHDAITAWLMDEKRGAHMAPEDRLEVARCLGHAGRPLLELALTELPKTLSATTVTKLREAIVACDVDPERVDQSVTSRDSVVERELDGSPLLAANYLAARALLREHWRGRPRGPAHALVSGHKENLDGAILTLRRDGQLLARDEGRADSDIELICAEARALLSYFADQPVATHALEAHVETVPQRLVDQLLGEAQALRNQNAALRDANASLGDAREAIASAQNGFAGIIIAAVVVAAVAALAFVDSGVLQVVGLFALALIWFVAFGLLDRRGLAPEWALKADLTPQELGRAISRQLGRSGGRDG